MMNFDQEIESAKAYILARGRTEVARILGLSLGTLRPVGQDDQLWNPRLDTLKALFALMKAEPLEKLEELGRLKVSQDK